MSTATHWLLEARMPKQGPSPLSSSRGALMLHRAVSLVRRTIHHHHHHNRLTLSVFGPGRVLFAPHPPGFTTALNHLLWSSDDVKGRCVIDYSGGPGQNCHSPCKKPICHGPDECVYEDEPDGTVRSLGMRRRRRRSRHS